MQNQASPLEESDRWSTRSSLPSLASRAAIELDNIIIGRDVNLSAVALLERKISDSFVGTGEPTRQSLTYDPSTAVAMNYALTDSEIVTSRLATVGELAKQAAELRETLTSVIRDPEEFQKENPPLLKKMRAFCIALSKHASAYEQSLNDFERSHPFRR